MQKTLSLKQSTDFQKILKHGKWINGEYLCVYFLCYSQCENNFLGIAVGKKGLNSVQRNRIKRLIREAYRLKEKEMKVGYQIVILWRNKNQFEMATFQNIYDDLENCLLKSGMLL